MAWLVCTPVSVVSPPLWISAGHSIWSIEWSSVIQMEAVCQARLLAQGGWLCSELDCDVVGPASSLTPREGQAHWVAVGDATILALQAGRLVEYDMQTRSATPTPGFTLSWLFA